ncbi:MAG: 2-oxoacid:acceptor oxidoreductase family protein [Candidatus Omnitrophota bacterium]
MKQLFHEQIVCAGFGGQGIMLMGKLLAHVGLSEGYNVTWLPSYGAEVRGGTAHSMVHITRERIASPTVSKPTTCFAMNKPSLMKFIDRVEKGGLLIVNASIIDKIPKRRDIEIAKLPLNRIASELGDVKAANMVAIGAFIRIKKMFSVKEAIKELGKVLTSKGDMFSINKKAIESGYRLADEK